jgi:DNA-binding MarR family transcriptional regulator
MAEFSVPARSDPTASLVRSVRRIAQAIDVRSREISRLTGLTLPQLLVLQSIRALGEVSTGAISRDVSMSSPTVVAVVDRLEAKGLIVRYRSSTDRRVVHARLTDTGRSALKDAPGLMGADALARWSALPAERQQTMAGAMTIFADLMAGAARQAPPVGDPCSETGPPPGH